MSLQDYERASLSTDIVLFRVVSVPAASSRHTEGKELQVLLMRRSEDPFKGVLALPGGIMGIDETLEENVRRKLKEKTGVGTVSYLSQLRVYDALGRDERGRVVSLGFLGLYCSIGAESLPEGVQWLPVRSVLSDDVQLAFDHKVILADALVKLGYMSGYSDVLTYLLPEYFTMAEYRAVSELVLGRSIPNFRRWASQFVEPTGRYPDPEEYSGQHRTPELYTRIK